MKDSLPTNDPAKVIKGAEFSTEFTAIQTAFGQAAPLASPTFTGTATFANITATGDTYLDNLTVGNVSHGVVIDYMAASALPFQAGLFTDASSGQTGYGSLAVKARTDAGGFYSISFFTASSDNTPVERVRIDSSGNTLIGTTSTTGSASNTTRVTGGIFSTHNGSNSVANATWTPLATIPTGEGAYLVTASLQNSTDPSNYNAIAVVTTSSTTANLTDIKNAPKVDLRMNGSAFEVNHGQGTTQTIVWSILRLA